MALTQKIPLRNGRGIKSTAGGRRGLLRLQNTLVMDHLLLMGRIFIQESANHFLVLCVIFFCLFLKKVHACFA